MKKYAALFLLSIGIALPALAAESAAPIERAYGGAPPCDKTQEQVTLQVSYNIPVASFTAGHTKFEEQNKKFVEMAKQNNLKKYSVQNQFYSINSIPSTTLPDGTPTSYLFTLNGNASYLITGTTAEATKFADFLTSQKMQVSLSSNMYATDNCQ